MTFEQLNLSEPLLKAVKEEGYTAPTPIQAQAIPAILQGKDVLAAAQTGTGKTAGFTLPLLQRLSENKSDTKKYKIRALVLTPTRELAAQVAESVKTYGKYLPFNHRVIFGGVGVNPQLADLRRGVDIVIATPGRLLDIMRQGGIDLSALEILVLDEADRMLDMGFINDIKALMKPMPKARQTLLFSATFSKEIKKLAATLLHDPVTIEVARENSTVDRIVQQVHFVPKSDKRALLTHLISSNNWEQVLVFTRTKHGANRLSKQLEEAGIRAAAIHGNKSQGARTKALAQFKAGEIRVLVATDIAARGLDIDQLPHVVNYELPNVPEDYVHRIGRTGRAGASGEAVSLVSEDEMEYLRGIEKLTGEKIPVSPESDPPTASAGKDAPKESDTNANPKQGRRRRQKSKEELAAEVGSKMLEKLEKMDKPKTDKPTNRRRRR